MKNIILSAFILIGIALANPVMADICVGGDQDFDPVSCEQLGGTVGTPLGVNSTPGGGTPPSSDPLGVPIDGGISLVLATGIAYGIKQLKKKRKINL